MRLKNFRREGGWIRMSSTTKKKPVRAEEKPGLNRRTFLRWGALGSVSLTGSWEIFAQSRKPAFTPRSGSSADSPVVSLPPAARARESARLNLMQGALGRKPADVVILNGTLVDTATAELIPETGIAIAGDRIAALGNVRHCVGSQTRVVDARGLHLVPGFVDAHYHCESSRLSPTQHARVTLLGGLISIFHFCIGG